MLADGFRDVGPLVSIVVCLEKMLTDSRKLREIGGISYEKPFFDQPHFQHAKLESC